MEYQLGNAAAFQSAANDSDTVLLLHMDGANDSTTITDSSASGHTCTANGDAKLKTAIKKYGSASLYVAGSDDYVSVADSADFNYGSDDFTIDTWIRFNSLPPTTNFAAMYFYEQYAASGRTAAYLYYRDAGPGYFIGAWFARAGFYSQTMFWEFNDVVVDRWYHIALIKGWGGNANHYACTVDGIQRGSAVTTFTDALVDIAGDVLIGVKEDLSSDLDAYIDEYRVSKGVARWTKNFIPPIGPYS